MQLPFFHLFLEYVLVIYIYIVVGAVSAQDVSRGQLISEEIFQNFCKCLRALVKPVS